MKHTVSHTLNEQQAKRAVEAAWAEYSQRFAKYSPTMTWQDDSRAQVGFKAKGVSLEGKLQIVPQGLALEMDLPFLLRPFSGKAVKLIEREVQRWVAHVQAAD